MQIIETVEEPYDAHVQKAIAVFRSCGFTLNAMQYKRSSESIEALRDFNRVPKSWVHPFAWNYHPNRWCRDQWETHKKLV